MADIESLVQAAQKEILDSYRKEFEQLSSTFRDLDSKAQGTATLAGVFLAAGLAILNRPGGLKSEWADVILLCGVVVLVAAILLSIQTLRVRKLRSYPSGEDVANLLADLQRLSDERELATRLSYFYGDAASLWRSCVKERRTAADAKARYLWCAQLCLAATSCGIALLIVLLIVKT